MLHASPAPKSVYTKQTRSLAEAAHAACEIAALEHLPICAFYRGDPERWHRETILKTVPVYGVRNNHSERIPASAQLNGDRAALDLGEWSDLTVKGADFQHYLDWLHTLW